MKLAKKKHLKLIIVVIEVNRVNAFYLHVIENCEIEFECIESDTQWLFYNNNCCNCCSVSILPSANTSIAEKSGSNE